MWTRELLKTNAKQALQGRYWRSFWICLVLSFVGLGGAGANSGNAAHQAVSTVTDDTTAYDIINSIPDSMLGAILVGMLIGSIAALCWALFVVYPLNVGRCRYFMESRQSLTPVSTVVSTFRRPYGNPIVVQLLTDLKIALGFLLLIVPVAWVFMASIKQNAEFYGNPWALPAGFYWQNFVNAWNGAKMGEYMLNSVIVTALALVLLLVIALPAAYCLSRFRFKGRKLLNTLFMAGLFINVNYIVVPIFLMLRDGDVWLKSHFGSSFLLNNLVVLAVVYAATALPFTIYLLSGYFATLPHDFEEAAYIDGASYFSTMTRIIFPMAKPSIITIILFNFLSFWNEYIISMTLMSSTSAPRTLPVGLLNLMQAQQSAAQYGTMYAGLVLVMLPTLILYICVQKQLTQGMTVGGLKG